MVHQLQSAYTAVGREKKKKTLERSEDNQTKNRPDAQLSPEFFNHLKCYQGIYCFNYDNQKKISMFILY